MRLDSDSEVLASLRLHCCGLVRLKLCSPPTPILKAARLWLLKLNTPSLPHSDAREGRNVVRDSLVGKEHEAREGPSRSIPPAPRTAVNI